MSACRLEGSVRNRPIADLASAIPKSFFGRDFRPRSSHCATSKICRTRPIGDPSVVADKPAHPSQKQRIARSALDRKAIRCADLAQLKFQRFGT